MNRRSFLMGTTALVASASLPKPLPTKAMSYITQAEAIAYASRPVGIALEAAKAGDTIKVLLSDYGAMFLAQVDRDMSIGEVLMSDNLPARFDGRSSEVLTITSLRSNPPEETMAHLEASVGHWENKTPQEIREDIRNGMIVLSDGDSLVFDIETDSNLIKVGRIE